MWMTGTGLASIVRKEFVAVSCENSGFAEFYNVAILEGRTPVQSFLRGLFGM